MNEEQNVVTTYSPRFRCGGRIYASDATSFTGVSLEDVFPFKEE